MLLLKVHDRKKTHDALANADALALARCFGTAGAPTDDDRARAARTLTNLRDAQRWIACMCNGEAGPHPLLAPRLREGGIHVVRLASADHRRDCPLWGELSDRIDGAGAGPEAVSTTWAGRWLLLNREATPVADPRARNQDADPLARSQRLPALARVLLTALSEVGYDVVNETDVETKKGSRARSRTREAYAALDQIRQREVMPGVAFQDIGCTYLPGVQRMLDGLPGKRRHFSETVRPQGLFIGVVQALEQKQAGAAARLCWSDASGPHHIEVCERVRLPGYVRETSGPFWVIAQAAQRAGEREFRLINAYAQPCLSRSVLLPVESDFERDTAEILLSLMTYWATDASRIGVRVQLQKPLFPEAVGTEGLFAQPDFSLWLPNGKRVLVEAMGLDGDEDYRLRKERTVPLMRQLPGVTDLVEFRPADDERDFRRRLTSAIARALR